jgi:hypothetical protein
LHGSGVFGVLSDLGRVTPIRPAQGPAVRQGDG